PAVRQRAHILLMLADGHPWSLITSALYCSSRTIDRWRQRFEAGGLGAILGLPLGQPTLWADEAEAILQDALKHSPDPFGDRAVNWTVLLLREHIGTLWGQRPSDRQVRLRLRELGYVWKRPRHALREPKSPRVLRRLRAIRKKVRGLPAGCVKLFEDETDLH